MLLPKFDLHMLEKVLILLLSRFEVAFSNFQISKIHLKKTAVGLIEFRVALLEESARQ